MGPPRAYRPQGGRRCGVLARVPAGGLPQRGGGGRIRALTAAAAAPARACAAFTATALACHDNTAPDGATAADNSPARVAHRPA
ncbi:hypothetical protein, partial [Mycobacterium tuberculosis]|uniref:hypothetical protein n=1 Tax=Mycobacterium tuberculosis TaxID=1773 RepID=UPI001BDF8C3C